ncbi:hypothetical protein RDWZM_004508 [Blomia tropicalis]|uniref:Tetraspanin n=1 Tax=Blomia tropicalis TaxID=40697 RepID=A0A9Q0RMN4_BLOTA|nr:hypothetical protein RDWZM_004508 [Blomia tropicalis]
MTSCRGLFARIVLVVINIVSAITGLILIVVGTQLQTQNDLSKELLPHVTISKFGFALMTIGAVLAIISIIGLAASLCDSEFILIAYVYLLILCFIIVLCTNFGFWIFRDNIFVHSRDYFDRLMSHSKESNFTSSIINIWQSTALCCGSVDYRDWDNYIGTRDYNQTNSTFGTTNATFNGSGSGGGGGGGGSGYYGDEYRKASLHHHQQVYPSSCCDQSNQMVDNGTFSNYCTVDHIYTSGCFSSNQIQRYKMAIQMLLVVVMLVLMTLLILICCLERDRKLESSQLINMQFACHLNTCRSSTRPYRSWSIPTTVQAKDSNPYEYYY